MSQTTLIKTQKKTQTPKMKSDNISKNGSDNSLNLYALHGLIGNRAVQRLMETSAVQRKLKIGKPNDKYEQEADKTADKVLKMTDPISTPGGTSQKNSGFSPSNSITSLKGIRRQAEEEKEESVQTKEIRRQPQEEKEDAVQTKSNETGNPTLGTGVESYISRSRGQGHSLDNSTRGNMESRMGTDFSKVSIHTDGEAAQASSSIRAQAFTHGSDIYFGTGKYSPGTTEGKHLIAHELTHVVQQGKGPALKRSDIMRRWYPHRSESEAPTVIQKDDEIEETVSPKSESGATKQVTPDVQNNINSIKDNGKHFPVHELTHTVQQGKVFRRPWREHNTSDCNIPRAKNYYKSGKGKIYPWSRDWTEQLYKIIEPDHPKLKDKALKKGKISRQFIKLVCLAQEKLNVKMDGMVGPLTIEAWMRKKNLKGNKKDLSLQKNEPKEYRVNSPSHPGWVEVKPTYLFSDWGEPFELPHFLKVKSNESNSTKIHNIEVCEAMFKGMDANIEFDHLKSMSAPKSNAKAIFYVNKFESKYSFGYFYYGNKKPIRAKTLTKNPVPEGVYDIEIPNYHHGYGAPYGDFGTTWFRIGHSGDRFLHPGQVSAGCVTVTDIKMWPSVYKYLIESRKDDRSVGTIHIAYSVNKSKK